MNSIDRAKLELQMAGFFDKDSDYEGMIGDAVMQLMQLFVEQGHSGYSAPVVASLFQKLANHEPLMPITGRDEEWGDVRSLSDGKPWYQNKRCSALFKDGEDGEAYYIDAIVKRDQNGVCWTGRCWISEEDYKTGDQNKMVSSKGYIKSFPFIPKTFYIDVKDVEISKDDWESFMLDPSQLDEIKEYYNL